MNVSTYIFGNLLSGYTQYPEDNKKTVFKSVADRIQSKTMIAIRRDGNLLRYIYTRKIKSSEGEGQYLGLALELNDVYCNDLSKLFILFDEALTKVVLNGKIIEFNDDGDIVAKTSLLYYERTEIERISNALSFAVEGLPSSLFKKLPPVNYSIGLNEGFRLTESASQADVSEALKVYNVINVYRDKDDSALDEYSKRLKTLNQKIQKLTSDISNLTQELSKVKRQKKRTTAVTLLSLLICAGVLVFISVSTNLNDRVRSLTSDNKQLTAEIDEKSRTIDDQRVTIQLYINDNRELKNQLEAINAELASYKQLVHNLNEKVSSLTNELYYKSKQLSSKEGELKKTSQRLTNAENERDNYRKCYTDKLNEVTSLQNKINRLNSVVKEYESKYESKGRRRR